MTKIRKIIKDRYVVISFFIAILLSVFGYFANNWALFTGETLSLYTNILDIEDDYTGVLFVNTSMDKQLIDVYEEGIKIGKTEITDRRKLLEFLKLLKRTDYKYVVIDIRFAEELASTDSVDQQIDKQLFDLIKSMDRCVVATHRDIKLLGGLESKAALADYKSTVTSTNFVRYEYFDGIPSIPLKVYNEMQKDQGLDTINYSRSSSLFGLYSEGGRLCQNSLFLEFSSKGFPQLKKIWTELGDSMIIEKYNYRNIGFDYINYLDSGKSENKVLTLLEGSMKEAGKGEMPIVFIGNLQEDLHDTYAGLQPGVIILYKALLALQEGRHIVNPLRVVFLFFVYFFICFFILKDKSLVNFIPEKIKRKIPFIILVCQFLTLTFLLIVIDIIDIKFFGVTTNFILVVIIFNSLKFYVQLKKAINHENKN